MIEEDLQKIVDNKFFLTQHAEVVMFLEDSKFLSYLRAKGLEFLIASTDINNAALNGQRAAGWQACLDLIVDFKEKILRPILETKATPRADFGSLDRAVESGDITKEEADAIRNNRTPTYTDSSGQPITVKPHTTI
jgi:hypothetical protein